MKEFLVKGNQISIAGELSQTEYQAKDGTTKTSMELNANIIDLVGGRKEGAAPRQAAPKADVAYDDDIPF
jgi:single-strand DNA-binding protein